MPGRVVIAGGGVAAIETAAALRALAGDAAGITVVAPGREVEQRPLAVTTPFGGAPPSLSLDRLADRVGFEVRIGSLAAVEPERHELRLGDGGSLGYEKLVVATGAVPEEAFPGAVTFASARDGPAVAAALRGGDGVAFVSPLPSGWTLPLYELALIGAIRTSCPDVAVVTAEPAPLWIFGLEAGEAIGEMLRRRGIGLLTGVRALRAADGKLELEGAEAVPVGHAVALPRLRGPAIAGLPGDEDGFVPVDPHLRVVGAADVYAAGDVAAFPLKQGGLAAEQADAAAESIAADLGVDLRPRPFEPILRGLLLTGGAPLYLRSDGASGSADRLPQATVSGEALWWPAAKVAGRYLAPLLAPGPVPDEMVELGEGDAAAPGGPDPTALTLLLAQEDAARGEYESALRGLDSAERLSDGQLAPEWERARTMWRARMEWGDRA